VPPSFAIRRSFVGRLPRLLRVATAAACMPPVPLDCTAAWPALTGTTRPELYSLFRYGASVAQVSATQPLVSPGDAVTVMSNHTGLYCSLASYRAPSCSSRKGQNSTAALPPACYTRGVLCNQTSASAATVRLQICGRLGLAE
jgi:hypothetical protein